MKVLITGSGGRLGAALVREFGARHEVVALNHAQLDFGRPGAIQTALEPLRFDALVNCAALTNVDYCETHREEAFRVNAGAAAELSRLCASKQARLIHISTDYVFDGERPGGYREEDPAEPVSVYGESKLQGEREALAASPACLVVRVSWVFGPDRPSFLDMIARRALENTEVAAVADKWSSPSYTLDLARQLEPLLAFDGPSGILHMCNPGVVSWQEYGQHALDCLASEGVELKARQVGALRLADMGNFVARRPVHTALCTERLAALSAVPLRSWREAVADYVRAHLAPALRQA